MAFTYTTARYNVIGKLRQNLYTGCAFSNGDTFVVGLNSLVQAEIDPPSTTTNVTYTSAAATPGPGQTTLTFSSTAPVTGLNIQLIGN